MIYDSEIWARLSWAVLHMVSARQSKMVPALLYVVSQLGCGMPGTARASSQHNGLRTVRLPSGSLATKREKAKSCWKGGARTGRVSLASRSVGQHKWRSQPRLKGKAKRSHLLKSWAAGTYREERNWKQWSLKSLHHNSWGFEDPPEVGNYPFSTASRTYYYKLSWLNPTQLIHLLWNNVFISDHTIQGSSRATPVWCACPVYDCECATPGSHCPPQHSPWQLRCIVPDMWEAETDALFQLVF